MPWTHEWAMWLLYVVVVLYLLRPPSLRKK